MEKPVSHRFVFEISEVLLVVVLCVVFIVIPNSRGNRTVDRSQQAMISEVQKAHLLGAGKPEVVAFFKRQNALSEKSYGTLQGDVWEEYLDNTVTTSTHGITLTGSSGVVAATKGYLGCRKIWSIETCVLFDGKGKVIAVEVRPTYSGCDI